jgi:3-phosphoinositide dependent protein kinase-1
LTRNNERILKLGNFIVCVSPQGHSPGAKNGDVEPARKFSRFFGGSTTKRRQRLVMVTSAGRVIIAAAGGDEKKAKLEIPLTNIGTVWRSFKESKGLTVWCIDTVCIRSLLKIH